MIVCACVVFRCVWRLCRPLSEVPEFWRAAPESALAWAAAEFELPSTRRGGREEDEDGETPALSQGGGGAPAGCGIAALSVSWSVRCDVSLYLTSDLSKILVPI